MGDPRSRKGGRGSIFAALWWVAAGKFLGPMVFVDWPRLQLAVVLMGVIVIVVGPMLIPERHRPRFRMWGFRIAAVLLTLTVSGLMLEGVLRLLGTRSYHQPRRTAWHGALRPPEDVVPGCYLQLRPYATFEHIYDGNPTGYFDTRNGPTYRLTYRTNRYGLRGPDFAAQKAPEVTRIMILGDSFVFGEGVRLEDTVTAQLERVLNARGGGRFEVINAAAAMWDTRCEINYLERDGVAFKPDVVMIVYVLNDATYHVGLDLWNNVTSTYQNRRLRKSYLFSYAYGAIARNTLTRGFVQEMVASARECREDWDNSFAALSRGREIATGIGARYIVFIYPFLYELSDRYPFLDMHAMVVAHCRAHDIEVIDLFPYYKGLSATALWAHPSDPHPNATGHGIAAEAIADYLSQP